MINKASIDNLALISTFLYAMYTEIRPDKATKDVHKYQELALFHLKNDHVFLYEDKAMFIMRDVSSPVIDEQLWDGVSVYIKPEYRKTTILSKLYKYMFNHFEGNIIGFVDVNSEHKKVVSKRHILLGNIYILNRREN